MKTVIETSLYLIILSFIVFISVDFILANKRITQVNETAQYIENLIETKTVFVDDNNIGELKLDKNFENDLKNMVANMGYELNMSYADSTAAFVYINYEIDYEMPTLLLKDNSKNTYHGLARFSKIERVEET